MFSPISVLNKFTQLRNSNLKYKSIIFKSLSLMSVSSLLDLRYAIKTVTTKERLLVKMDLYFTVHFDSFFF